MKTKAMDKLMQHLDTYFEQTDCTVLHPIADVGMHIDVLVYKPTDKYPFWKLVTMGASDFKMPPIENTISRRNEYIMFVDSSIDLTDMNTVSWYHNKLMTVATFAQLNNTHITYGHSFEWKNDDPDDGMIAAFIEFPQIIENPGILRCKLDMFDTSALLQVVLLNENELNKLMEMGPQQFSEYLYPEDGTVAHFLSEKIRTDKF